jgi:hypothetical protein
LTSTIDSPRMETMSQSESLINLTAALIASQREFQAVRHNAANDYFDSTYADFATVVEQTRPIVLNHGLVITQLPGGTHENPTLETKLLHESGEWIAETMPLFLVKNDPHNHGSAITYAKRYAYSSILGLTTEKDDDGNAASYVSQSPAPAPSHSYDPGPADPETGELPFAPTPAQTAAQHARAASNGRQAPTPQGSGSRPSGGNTDSSRGMSEGQGKMIRRLYMVTKNDHGWSRDDWSAQIEFASDGATTDDRKLTFDQSKTFITTVKSLIGED